MNKSELVEAVAESADISKAAAARAVDTMVSSIIDTLAKGDQVAIAGFGTFTVRDRAARTGRNPRTGEEIQIKASKILDLKLVKHLKMH